MLKKINGKIITIGIGLLLGAFVSGYINGFYKIKEGIKRELLETVIIALTVCIFLLLYKIIRK